MFSRNINILANNFSLRSDKENLSNKRTNRIVLKSMKKDLT